MNLKGIGSATFDRAVAITISITIFSSVVAYTYHVYFNKNNKLDHTKYVEILNTIHNSMVEYYGFRQGNFKSDIKSFKSLLNSGLIDTKKFIYSKTDLYDQHLAYDTLTVDNKYRLVLFNDCRQFCPQYDYTYSYIIEKNIITSKLCREIIKNFSMKLTPMKDIEYDVLIDFRYNSPYVKIDASKGEDYNTQVCSNIKEKNNDYNMLIRFLQKF